MPNQPQQTDEDVFALLTGDEWAAFQEHPCWKAICLIMEGDKEQAMVDLTSTVPVNDGLGLMRGVVQARTVIRMVDEYTGIPRENITRKE